MKLTQFFHALSLAAIAGIGVHSASAQTVTTDAVGFVDFDVPAGSDKTVGLPLHRPVAIETSVTDVSGDVITVGATLVADQFVFADPTQLNHYYVRVTKTGSPTSAVLGRWYDVTDNGTGDITVADPDLATTIEAQGLAVGDTVQVVPYWSLDTLLPQGGGLDSTTDFTSLQGTVQIQPQMTAGTNLAAASQHIYWTGGQSLADGWYNIGTGLGSGTDPIAPDTFLGLRNPGGLKSVTIVGAVPVADEVTTSLVTLQADTAQDNMVSNGYPVPLTLAQLQLFESGAFVSTTDFTVLKDQLLLFPPTPNGINVAPARTLIYWTGGQSLADGWYDIGSGAGPLDNSEVIGAGQAFIVRKAGTPGNGVATSWSAPRPYPAD
jgi:uncharacterized protein (TIGR02597 family)